MDVVPVADLVPDVADPGSLCSLVSANGYVVDHHPPNSTAITAISLLPTMNCA